jgi:hypothetical protein
MTSHCLLEAVAKHHRIRRVYEKKHEKMGDCDRGDCDQWGVTHGWIWMTAINGMQQSNSTLRWDQNLPAAQRFVILAAFNNDAVLDKNTGLVWEKSPATTANPWGLARSTCLNKNVGGQKGWRLPAIAELTSLINPSVPSSGPALPPGHPFTNVLSLTYWSASTVTDNPANGWTVNFVSSDAVSNLNQKTDTFRLWCVRGGMNADQY